MTLLAQTMTTLPSPDAVGTEIVNLVQRDFHSMRPLAHF
jgi:hypothetical protein